MKQKVQRFLDNFRFIFQPRRKPLLITRIASSYIKYIIYGALEKKPLRNIDIALNYACNLACRHCSCEALKSSDTVLSEAQYSQLAGEAVKLGAIYFAFTGGEPLVNKNLEDIIRLFFPSRSLIGLQTNALLLNTSRIESLYKAGVDVLQVSLDSFDPDEHDSFRNKKGAFRETLKNVDMAFLRGIKIIFSVTFTHNNIKSEGILNLLSFSARSNIPVVVSIPCPVGKWSGNFSEMFDNDDREYFALMQKRFPHLRRDFDSNYLKCGCSAGIEKLYITPYGDVIPCPFIHISFGNIKTESLSSIRNRMLKLEKFREYNQVCLAGEDRTFIENYIIPTYKAKQLPQMWKDHPVLSKSLKENYKET
ncbi:MAG: radical SAM protein [Nitrospirae bacterium]|nr:radical SAM protein [Nitrospirota bacterium]